MAQILIAEDDKYLRLLLVDILTDAGYEVTAAANGVEALEQIQASLPDLLLLDLMMPIMDGFEVMTSLQDIPAARGMPIIVLSGVPPRKGEARAWKLGARHYIPKPFNPMRVELSVKVALRDAAESDGRADGPNADQLYRPGSVEQMADHDSGQAFVKTGHEYLDLILGGGIRLPSLTLVEGGVSIGKGVLCQHISYEALQAGHGVTYFTSQHSPRGITRQMDSLGMDVANAIRDGLLHVTALQQPSLGDRCAWSVSPEHLMIALIEDLQSQSAQREIIVLDDISDMLRYGEETNVLQMITECGRLRDEGSSIIAISQSLALDRMRRDHFHELCDLHVSLQATSLGGNKGILLTVHKANGAEFTARNTVAFKIVSGIGIRAIDVPRVRA